MTELVDRQLQEPELEVERARSRLAAYCGLMSSVAFAVSVILFAMAYSGLTRDAGDADILKKIDAHSAQLIFSGLFRAVAFALLAIVLGHIAIAVRARKPQLPKVLPIVAYAGPALVAITAPLFTIAQVSVASDFVGGPNLSNDAAAQALEGNFYVISAYASIFALFLCALAWLATGLYGMRLGLLTRLVGGVAIALGVAYVLTSTTVLQPPVITLIQMFWLGAVSVMLLGKGARSVPPAWVLGRAVPWTEVQQIQAQQAAAATENPADFEKAAESQEPPAVDSPVEPDGEEPTRGTGEPGPRAD